MTFTGITATEDQINQKTGANVPATFTSDMKTQALLQAESYLNNLTGFNWSDWYATSPNVDVKYSVTELTASLVAIEAIKYDMVGYTTPIEAENMITILAWRVKELTKLFLMTGTQEFMEKESA